MSNTFTNQKKALERVLLKLPVLIAEISKNAFKDNFKKNNQGFFGKKWKTVLRKDPKSKWYKGKKQADKPILSMNGHLKKSIRVDSVGQGKMLIVSDLEYSAKHNEGQKGKLAKRQFIGEHEKLNKACMLEISDNLKKVL